MKDIKNRDDIKALIDAFYNKVRQDATIGYLFNEVAKVNWEKHLPVMYEFWEQIIFNTGNYKGNPMVAHRVLHEKSPLNKDHFKRWLALFHTTVDEMYEGPNAILVKQRAESIARIMQVKVLMG